MDKQTSTIAIGLAAAGYLGYCIGSRQQKTLQKKLEAKTTDEITRLIRENIVTLTPYRCARDDYDEGILLDANENSLGPPFPSSNAYFPLELERYPCPYQVSLKEAFIQYRMGTIQTEIVNMKSLTKENVFLGVGSDEAIDILIRVVCIPKVDSILITPPTYGMYQVCANINDIHIISVPLVKEIPKENPNGLIQGNTSYPSFHLNTKAILKAITKETKIIFLCSPGNPTANSVRLQDIEEILNYSSYNGLVVVDEAYIDFATTFSLCHLVTKYRRLVVLQTLSKSFGLAGIRLGAAFGDPVLIQTLNNVKAPYNINKLTSKVAMEALQNTDQVMKNIQFIKKEKQVVIQALQKLPYIKCIYASDSNFVLFQIPQALTIYRTMAARGIVIRYRGNQMMLNDCLRATIGTKDENMQMLELLQQVAQELQLE